MKIVFLSDDFPPESFGGAGISTFELAKSIQSEGHQVFVVTTCRDREKVGESEYEGLKVFKIFSKYPAGLRWYLSLHNPQTTPSLKKILKNIRPDVVHVNNIHQYLSYHSLKLAKLYSKAIVFTARDVMPFNFAKLDTKKYLDNLDAHTTWRDHIKQAGKRWNPLRNFFIRRYLKCADKITAISFALKRALQENGISGAEVVHVGIDPKDWEPNLSGVEEFKKKFNLLDKRVLLFSGRLSAPKGGGKVLEALSTVARSFPDVVLLVAGSKDEYARSMERYAAELGVEINLVFTGWLSREDVKLSYAASEAVLMPSICFDSLGRVNLEAMASSRPVVGTRFGGAPEVIEDGKTGYIVDPRFPDKIAEKVLDLLKNPAKAKAFGEVGRARVLEKFDLKDKAREILNLYQKELGRRASS